VILLHILVTRIIYCWKAVPFAEPNVLEEAGMTEPERIGPTETYEKLKARAALLVCAYEDEEKFKVLHLEGAMSLGELRSRLNTLSKDQEIIFYCA
jgi:hypothetical protein